MNNYLSYIGLAFSGYFFGLRFVLLCTSIYNTFIEQSSDAFYKLYFMVLLYFYGFPGLLYLYMLKKLYDIVCDYNTYIDYYHKGVNEYQNFMKYYDGEVEKNPEKSSKLIENWKKGLILYDRYRVKGNQMIKELYHNYYYLVVLTVLNQVFYYTDVANRYLDGPFNKLKEYVGSKIDIEKYQEMFADYNKQLPVAIEDKKDDNKSIESMPSFPNTQNMEGLLKDLPAFKQDLDKLMKSMPADGNMSLDEMQRFNEMMKNIPPPSQADMRNFETMMRSMPDMNEFITSLNNSGNLRKRNTSKKNFK